MNKRSRQRNKERNKYAVWMSKVNTAPKGVDPLEIPNCSFSNVKDWMYLGPQDVEKLAKYKKQRIERGFDDTELWSFDVTIAKFVLPRLIEFRKVANGYPADFKTFENWLATIDKMIYAFDHLVNEEKYDDERDKELELHWIGMYDEKKLPDGNYEIVYGKNYDEEKMKKYHEMKKEEAEKIDEGLQLFGKHFRALWW